MGAWIEKEACVIAACRYFLILCGTGRAGQPYSILYGVVGQHASIALLHYPAFLSGTAG